MIVHAGLLTAKEALLGIDDRFKEVGADAWARHRENYIVAVIMINVRYDCLLCRLCSMGVPVLILAIVAVVRFRGSGLGNHRLSRMVLMLVVSIVLLLHGIRALDSPLLDWCVGLTARKQDDDQAEHHDGDDDPLRGRTLHRSRPLEENYLEAMLKWQRGDALSSPLAV